MRSAAQVLIAGRDDPHVDAHRLRAVHPLGSNPGEVRHGALTVLRVVDEEEDAGRELLVALGAEQQARAVICAVAPPDFVLMNLPRVPEQALPGEASAGRNIQAQFDKLSAEHRQALTLPSTPAARRVGGDDDTAARTPLGRGTSHGWLKRRAVSFKSPAHPRAPREAPPAPPSERCGEIGASEAVRRKVAHSVSPA